ncbi:hypothetical protein OG727_21390 [Streptomyces caniferus]|uniref:CMP/dCMP-type deaminase domain-containing protein n=1 Tax=Streptomyces caniferus TaxID=285557 RepID=A0ABZ1VMS9_9ACTN|nr:hypothetical protein [Streptomyces caniferus]
MSIDPEILRIAREVSQAAEESGPANVNAGVRYGGQSVVNISHGGDYHEGDYAEHVYGDQSNRRR